MGMILGVVAGASGPALRSETLEVTGGVRDRRDAVVRIAPGGGRPKQPPTKWRDDSGSVIQVQWDPDGGGWLVVPGLHAGEVRRWVPEPAGAAAMESVRAEREGRQIRMWQRGREVFRYQAEPGEFPRAGIPEVYRRGGYIQSVFTPSGKLATDDFPTNHVHHHGIWSPWTKTIFEGRTPDFWNMGAGKGRVEPVGVDEVWSGAVHGGFRVRHRFVDSTVQPAVGVLDETWEVRLFDVGTGNPSYSLIELVITQQCRTASPLRLPKYHYGGLGLRGNGEWNAKTNCFWLTSEGETDRVRGNETRGRWCWLGGRVGGSMLGTAVLGAPENFRAPQPMRLNPDEPFFCFAPSQLGDWEITPAQPYVARYRFLVADGAANVGLIEGAWEDLAEPLKGRWVP